MRHQPEGIFALGEGIEIASEDDGELTLTCQLSALVAEDDSISLSGVSLEIARSESIDSSVVLDADECDALAGLLVTAAERLRTGDWEREVQTRIETENASD